MSKLNLSCREASRLISESKDRDLGLGEKLTLRIHLGLCTACTRFTQQLDFLREAMKRYPERDDDAERSR